MFFHWQIFVYALIFFGGLEVFSLEAFRSLFASSIENRPLLSVAFLLLLLVYVFLVARKVGRRLGLTSLAVLLTLSAVGLLYFISKQRLEQVFIVLASSVYYILHISIYRLKMYAKDQTSRGLLGAVTMATLFMFYAATYGIYLNFAVPLWALVIAFFLATFVGSLEYYLLLESDRRRVLNYSLIIALLMAEIAWMINFWPFGYLTTAVITLTFYYVFWDILDKNLQDKLTRRRVLANMALMGILVVIVLSSSKWVPVV